MSLEDFAPLVNQYAPIIYSVGGVLAAGILGATIYGITNRICQARENINLFRNDPEAIKARTEQLESPAYQAYLLRRRNAAIETMNDHNSGSSIFAISPRKLKKKVDAMCGEFESK